MLVLSRRAEQKIVFPHLGITVKVLKVSGRLVKIGVEAPKSVKVLRPEVCDDEGLAEGDHAAGMSQHDYLNQVNSILLRLQAMQLRLDRGAIEDADGLLESLIQSTSSIDHEIAPVSHDGVGPGRGRPKRLLVVEDCDNERRLMAYLLASNGFDVTVARDGSEALEQLRSSGEVPDFVLMDMQMPLVNGLETLLQIRQDDRLSDVKVFAVTASPRSAELEPMGRGWDGWFQKPLDMEVILQTLHAEPASAVGLRT